MKNGSNFAAAINAAHASVEQAKRDGVRHAIECGRLLQQAKATVAHGQSDAWVSKQCSFSMRTAQLYMRVAKHVGDDPAKAQRVADLSLREIGRALSDRPVSRPQKRLSDPAQADLHGMLALWYQGKPEWRDEFLRRLCDEADRQGVPPAQVVFRENGAGREAEE